MTLRFATEQEFEQFMSGRPSKSEHLSRVNRSSRPIGRMNKTEAAFSRLLELQKRAGEILSYRFEEQKFRLAQRTYYTPDFKIVYPDGTQEFIEVKGGFIRDDAMVKFKVCARHFPEYGWRMVQRKKTQWITLFESEARKQDQ
jgi:hypothetical protein